MLVRPYEEVLQHKKTESPVYKTNITSGLSQLSNQLMGGAWRSVMGVDATILVKTSEANDKVCGDSLAKPQIGQRLGSIYDNLYGLLRGQTWRVIP